MRHTGPADSAVVVVPARLASSRFPGKPLVPVAGVPLVERVRVRCTGAALPERVVVATCDEEIAQAVTAVGGEVVMTSPSHVRATDRVAEAAAAGGDDIVVMVQGDEPLVVPSMIDSVIEKMRADPDIGCLNLTSAITNRAEVDDPNTIKVVGSPLGQALYFSRSPIPAGQPGAAPVRYLRQVCVIGFRRATLQSFASLAPTPLEAAESIDMLRFLEHGRAVHLLETPYRTHAVDVESDVRTVEHALSHDPDQRRIETDSSYSYR